MRVCRLLQRFRVGRAFVVFVIHVYVYVCMCIVYCMHVYRVLKWNALRLWRAFVVFVIHVYVWRASAACLGLRVPLATMSKYGQCMAARGAVVGGDRGR
jgi:hypothetical protein